MADPHPTAHNVSHRVALAEDAQLVCLTRTSSEPEKDPLDQTKCVFYFLPDHVDSE